MVTGVRESTRTLLYSTCIFGLWVPIVWLVGAVLVVRELRVAPPSTYKRGMHVSFGLVLSLLALFGVAAAIAGVSVQRFIEIAMVYAVQNPQWQLNLKIISGFLLSLYAIGGLLFVAFADATFRSTLGPVVNELHAPLFLRGVHLGLNISGMLLPMPLFSMVGIPVTLRQISAMRRKGGAPACFTSTWVCGILAFVSIVAVFLFIVIGGSMPSGQKREDFAATQLAKLEMGCFNRTNVNATSDTFAISTTTTTTSTTTTNPFADPPTTTTSTFADPPFDKCPDFSIGTPIPWLLLSPVFLAIIAVPVLFNIVFVALGDRVILNEILPPTKLVRPCTSCGARIQFITTAGEQKPLRIKCYKCNHIDFYQDLSVANSI